MKIEAKYKPELCVCRDTFRENIAHVQVDVSRKRMVATTGQMLVVVPAEPQEGDTAGVVPAEPIKAARKLAGKMDVEFRANGEVKLLNGATYPRPQVDFPHVDQVIPPYKKGDEGTLTIGLDARYLLTLAEALGAHKTMTRVHLTIKLPAPGEQVLDPYVVTAENEEEPSKAFGVLMPCRL